MSASTVVVTEATLDPATLERLLAPRDGLVLERAEGGGRFAGVGGPFSSYERVVQVEPAPPGGQARRVRQEVSFDLALPWFSWLFARAVRTHVGRVDGAPRWPWWSPPARLDARAAAVLAHLCMLAIVTGYLGTLLTQTITFAAHEFGADKRAQSLALSVVRADVVLAVVLVAVADRRGRRPVLLWTMAIGCVLTATGAAAPSLPFLAASQVVARGFVTAAAIALAIDAAEEMPSGARAYAVSLMAMTAGLGAGLCVFLLRLADLGEPAWRLLYAAAVAGVPLVVAVGRRLPESLRFGAGGRRPAPASPAGRATPAAPSVTARRFWLLAASAFLLNVFFTPASQFGNEYLRTEHGYSASDISWFTILTGLPGGIGMIVGGRLAERGRRVVGAVAVIGGVGATVIMYQSHGWPLWAWSAVGSVVGAATVPALGVYGPELFATSLRGRANGTITALGRAGGVLGLLVAGAMSSDGRGLGGPLALLAIGPALLAVLVLTVYPETAHRELEELNPEDAPRPP